MTRTRTGHVLAARHAILRDADRLVVGAERLAGAAVLEPVDTAALTRAVSAWARAVGAHAEALDGAAERAALRSALDRLRSAADALAAGPDEDTATVLAVELAELRDVLRELLDDQQALLLARGVPAVSRREG